MQLLKLSDILTISRKQMIDHEHCELAAGDFTNQPNNALSVTHIRALINTDSYAYYSLQPGMKTSVNLDRHIPRV